MVIFFMAPIVWHWSKGSSHVYTRNTVEAADAMKKGYLVSTIKMKRRIFRK